MIRYFFRSCSGSFFRTIGRIIAYFLVGVLLYFAGSYFNILKVNAYSLYGHEVTGYYSLLDNYENLNFRFTYSTSSTGQSNSVVTPTIRKYASEANGYKFIFNGNNINQNEFSIYELAKNGLTGAFGFYITLNKPLSSVSMNDSSYCEITSLSSQEAYYNGLTYGEGDWYGYLGTNLYYNYFVYCSNENNANYIFMFFNGMDSIGNGLTSSNIYPYIVMTGSIVLFEEDDDTTLADVEDSINDVNDSVNNLNDSITSSDTSESESSASGFFDSFDNEDYGLSDIITMPLELITQITSATCTPLEIPLPFIENTITLPCMYTIYSTYFGSFLSLYQTITFGMIAYAIIVKIFGIVQNLKDPDNDEIEVVDL